MGEGLRGRKIFFLVNAYAGGGKAKSWWQRTLPQLERLDLDFFWQYSEGGTATVRQVREAVLLHKAQAVVTIGGDGTLHEALNGLLEEDQLLTPELVFAVYPAGSACDFTRMIYPQRGDTSLIDLLLEGEVRPVDVGCCTYQDVAGQPQQTYFLNGSDIGLGAETCFCVNAHGGRLKRVLRFGPLAFVIAALVSLLRFRYCPVEVEADGERLDGQYLIAGVGNGQYMGGKMRLFPEARLDDGLLDLLLVEKMRIPTVLRLFIRVYCGGLLELKQVQYRQLREATLRPQQPLKLELDGELPGTAPARIRVLPGCLRLLMPKT